ncbi:MAG: hypothetical protein OXG05_14505 [Gammaproteobacteria bacterium]|nr:hypothetical protein [Gammaproteobacteria bacterium]
MSCTPQPPLVIPESTPSMIEIYQRHAFPSATGLGSEERRNSPLATHHVPKTETPLLTNAVIHMYVYPHVSTSDGIRIPGYWTSFQLYELADFLIDRARD